MTLGLLGGCLLVRGTCRGPHCPSGERESQPRSLAFVHHPRCSPPISTTYPYALLDEVILVAAQLRLQHTVLLIVVLVCPADPAFVELGERVFGGGDAEAVPGDLVVAHVGALFCLDYGGPERVDAEMDRGATDVEEAIEPGSSWARADLESTTTNRIKRPPSRARDGKLLQTGTGQTTQGGAREGLRTHLCSLRCKGQDRALGVLLCVCVCAWSRFSMTRSDQEGRRRRRSSLSPFTTTPPSE